MVLLAEVPVVTDCFVNLSIMWNRYNKNPKMLFCSIPVQIEAIYAFTKID
jgi:hypothetical protein